jgi:hypothetical protein
VPPSSDQAWKEQVLSMTQNCSFFILPVPYRKTNVFLIGKIDIIDDKILTLKKSFKFKPFPNPPKKGATQ